jgi:hypothetical protein
MLTKKIIKNRAKLAMQRGVTLLELVMVLGLLALIAVGEIEDQRRKIAQERTRAMAQELMTYNNGVRSHIGLWAGQMTTTYTPPEVQGNRTGVAWLKSSSDCAGNGGTNFENFVPCNFLIDNGGVTSFGGLTFETYLTSTPPASPNGRGTVTAVTVLSMGAGGGPWTINGEETRSLSGLAALLVNGANRVSETPASFATNTRAVYCITAGSASGVCDSASLPSATYAVGKIALTASNEANTDSWLRTDGSNLMLNDLRFDDSLPYDNRELRNVSRLLGSATEGMVIGQGGTYGASVPGSGLVVVNANEEIYGSLIIRGNTTVEGANFAVNNGNATITNGSLAVNNGNISTTGNLTVGQNINAAGTITAGSDIFGRDVYARRLIDSDNTAYLVDPASISALNRLRANSLTNRASNTDLVIGTKAGADGSNPGGRDVITRSERHIAETADNDITSTAGGAYTLQASGNAQLISSSGGNNATFQASSGGAASISATGTASINSSNTIIQAASQRGLEVSPTRTTLGNTSNDTYIDSDIDNTWIRSGGSFIKLSSIIQKSIFMGSEVIYNNATINKPSCASGYSPKITIMPIEFTLGTRSETSGTYSGKAISTGHMTWYAFTYATYWLARMESNHPDTDVRNLSRGKALATIYCRKV